jgi:hypothetical protein
MMVILPDISETSRMTPSRRLTGQQMIRKHTITTDLCIQNQHMTTRECHSGTIQMHSTFSRRISQQANINQETKSECQRSCGNQGLSIKHLSLMFSEITSTKREDFISSTTILEKRVKLNKYLVFYHGPACYLVKIQLYM